jgi:hypothetical protein
MLDARYSFRRLTVPPEACTHTRHASLRDTSARTWRATATATTIGAAPVMPVSSSSHFPTSTITSTTLAPIDALNVRALRRRSDKAVLLTSRDTGSTGRGNWLKGGL